MSTGNNKEYMVFLVAEKGYPKKPFYYALEKTHHVGQLLRLADPEAGPVLDIRGFLGHEETTFTMGAKHLVVWTRENGPYQLLLGVLIHSGRMETTPDIQETSAPFVQLDVLPAGYASGTTLRILNMAWLENQVKSMFAS